MGDLASLSDAVWAGDLSGVDVAIRAGGIGSDVLMRDNPSTIRTAYDVSLDYDSADATQIDTARGKHVFDHVVLNHRARPAVLCIPVNHAETCLQRGQILIDGNS